MGTFHKNTLWIITHFGKIHFGSKKLGDGGDLLDDGGNLLGDGVELLSDGVDLLGDGVDLLGDGGDLFGEGVDLLGDGGNLLGDGVDFLGDGVDLLGDGGDPKSIAGYVSMRGILVISVIHQIWVKKIENYVLCVFGIFLKWFYVDLNGKIKGRA